MDWNFKPNSGYLSEFNQESDPNVSSMDGSSISFDSPRLLAKGECSFDLKLGHVGNFSASTSCDTGPVISSTMWKKAAGPKLGNSLGSGSSKRARGRSNRNQTAFCLVDECNSDLSNCREYHRRHKVCEVHSKTSVVTINGQKQRFCQHCSRFHSLEEFDEGRRSCRKRLDGHNRRRRKTQPVPISYPESFLISFRGKLTDFLTNCCEFSSSRGFPATTANGLSSGQHQTSSSYKARKQFQFLQDDSPSSSHNWSSSERLTSCIQNSSDCAPSLLSYSSSQPMQPPDIGPGHHHVLQQSGSVPLALQPFPSLVHERPMDAFVYDGLVLFCLRERGCDFPEIPISHLE